MTHHYRSGDSWARELALCCAAILVLAGCKGEVPTAAPGSGTTTDAQPGDSTSTAPDTLRRLVILNNGDSPFWDACRYGMNDAQRNLKLGEAGFKAVMEVNDGTPEGQLNFLRQFGSQSDIAAVGISATDAQNAAIAEEMRKLQQKGVKVITIDSDVDRDTLRDARIAFVGTDNYAAGRELGICAKHLLPTGGEYVTFVGRTGAQNAIERVAGFAEGAGQKFKALDNMGDETDRTRARENVRNAVQNHPGLNLLVGIWSYNAPAIVDAVKALGKRDEMTIVTFDAEQAAVQHMGDGMIDAMMVQNPYAMGFQGVRLMKALVENDEAVLDEMLPRREQPGGDVYDTGLRVVVPVDSPLKPEMFGKSTEFYTLDKFKQWLDEYGLEGS